MNRIVNKHEKNYFLNIILACGWSILTADIVMKKSIVISNYKFESLVNLD